MTASPATLDRFTAALAGNGGGTVVRVAALTSSRPAGAIGAMPLQSGPESPDAAEMDISAATFR